MIDAGQYVAAAFKQRFDDLDFVAMTVKALRGVQSKGKW